MLSTTVRLYGLRWEGSGAGRRLRGQVALLAEVYRPGPAAGRGADHRKEVTDALDA